MPFRPSLSRFLLDGARRLKGAAAFVFASGLVRRRRAGGACALLPFPPGQILAQSSRLASLAFRLGLASFVGQNRLLRRRVLIAVAICHGEMLRRREHRVKARS
jgi:hypothetical protein